MYITSNANIFPRDGLEEGHIYLRNNLSRLCYCRRDRGYDVKVSLAIWLLHLFHHYIILDVGSTRKLNYNCQEAVTADLIAVTM